MYRKKMTEEDKQLKQKIRKLRDEIAELRRNKQPRSVVWESCRQGRNFETPQALRLRKTIVEKDGGEVTAIDLGADNTLLVLSAGAKSVGSVQVFNTAIDNGGEYVPLPNSWQQTAAIEKEESRLFAVGGLNNMPYIYDLGALATPVTDQGSPTIPANTTLVGHSSAIYECRFVNRNQLVSVGDQTVRLWDIEQAQCTKSFIGHTGDVFCVDNHPDQSVPVFISGAGDFTARLWDGRVNESDSMRGQASLTFDTMSRDVNGVSFFPDGKAFAAALNNSAVHLYDTRASTKILTLQHPLTHNRTAVNDVKFSSSGRLIFVLYANQSVLVYDLAGATTDSRDGEVINQNILADAIPSEKCESIAVSPSGAVFGVGVKAPNKSDTITHLYWPNGKVRRR